MHDQHRSVTHTTTYLSRGESASGDVDTRAASIAFGSREFDERSDATRVSTGRAYNVTRHTSHVTNRVSLTALEASALGTVSTRASTRAPLATGVITPVSRAIATDANDDALSTDADGDTARCGALGLVGRRRAGGESGRSLTSVACRRVLRSNAAHAQSHRTYTVRRRQFVGHASFRAHRR
jgi:hypothetical protein